MVHPRGQCRRGVPCKAGAKSPGAPVPRPLLRLSSSLGLFVPLFPPLQQKFSLAVIVSLFRSRSDTPQLFLRNPQGSALFFPPLSQPAGVMASLGQVHPQDLFIHYPSPPPAPHAQTGNTEKMEVLSFLSPPKPRQSAPESTALRSPTRSLSGCLSRSGSRRGATSRLPVPPRGGSVYPVNRKLSFACEDAQDLESCQPPLAFHPFVSVWRTHRR